MIQEIVDEVAQALADAGLPKVKTFMPHRPTPPEVVVMEGEPFITPGETLSGDDWTFQLHIFCTVGNGTNEREIQNLRAMIEKCITNIPGNWVVSEVGAPYIALRADAAWLQAEITINDRKRINLYEGGN